MIWLRIGATLFGGLLMMAGGMFALGSLIGLCFDTATYAELFLGIILFVAGWAQLARAGKDSDEKQTPH